MTWWGEDQKELELERGLALDRQLAPLVVVEADLPIVIRFRQDLVLGAEVLDDLLQPPADQSGEGGQEKAPGRRTKCIVVPIPQGEKR